MNCKGINKCCNTNIYSFDEAGQPPLAPIPPIVPGPPSPPPDYPLPPGPGAPPPPSIVSATLQSDNSITVAWNSATGALGYNLYRSTTSGGPYTLVQAGITALSYNDATVLANTTYYYVVQSENATESGTYSTEVSAKTNPAFLRMTIIQNGQPVSTPVNPPVVTLSYYDITGTLNTITNPATSTTYDCYPESTGTLPAIIMVHDWAWSNDISNGAIFDATLVAHTATVNIVASTDPRSLVQAKSVITTTLSQNAIVTAAFGNPSGTDYSVTTGAQSAVGTYSTNATFPITPITVGATGFRIYSAEQAGLTGTIDMTSTIKLAW